MTPLGSTSVTIDEDFCYQVIKNRLFPLSVAGQERIGIEIEMLAVKTKGTGVPEHIPFWSDKQKGLREMLHEISDQEGWEDNYQKEKSPMQQALKIKLGGGDNLTFEPGGQIEYSSCPYLNLSEAMYNIADTRQKIATNLAKHSVEVFQLGINPWHTTEEIGLQITKDTYLLLNEHFTQISPHGIRMMRQTCTNQVNLDFGADENTLVKRFLASNLIAPYAAAIFANSGVWDLTKHDFPGFRSKIWREADRSRTGFPDLASIYRKATRASCVRSFFDFAMSASVIHTTGSNQRPFQGMSFGTWLAEGMYGLYPTAADFDAHLYTLFPEVRPRGYLELRSVDSQASVWQFVPAAFYLGIIYSATNLDLVVDTLSSEVSKLDTLMDAAQYGLSENAESFINRAKWLMELAIDGANTLPHCFRNKDAQKGLKLFYERFTLKNKTPSAEIQMVVKNSGKGYLCVSDLLRLERDWFNYKSQ